MENNGLKKVLKISAILIVGILVVFCIIVAHEMQYVDEEGEPAASFTTELTIGDDVPSQYDLKPDAGMTFVYAEVTLTNHDFDWINMDPMYWLLRCKESYFYADLAKSAFLTDYHSYRATGTGPHKAIMVFQIPIGMSGEHCCIYRTVDTYVSNDSCMFHELHYSQFDEPEVIDGAFYYELSEGYTFEGADQWDSPGDGKKYIIADVVLTNISGNYAISTNDLNFQLDAKGLRYNSSLDSAIGNNLVEVTQGHFGTTVILFKVPESVDISDCRLVWDGFWSNVVAA